MDLDKFCWYAFETFKKKPLAASELESKTAKQYFDDIADAFAKAQKFFTPDKGDLYLRIASHYIGMDPLPKGTEKLLSQEARTNWRTRIGSQYSVRGLVVPIAWLSTFQTLPGIKEYLDSIEKIIATDNGDQATEFDKFTVAAVMWMRLEQEMSAPHKESLYRFQSNYIELVLKHGPAVYSAHDAPLLQMYLAIGSANSLKAHEARPRLLSECEKSTQIVKEAAVRNSQELNNSEKVEQIEELHRQRTVYG